MGRAGKRSPGRIGQALARARSEGRVALIAYLTAGYPEPEATPGLVRALVDGGADAIELGVPFSDPLADGATIQRASWRALEAGMTTGRCLKLVRELRNKGVVIPLIVMTYYNPILAYGQDVFVQDAAAAGVDGLIAVDVPPEEAGELAARCRAGGLDLIPLLAPTSTDERIALAARQASGFLYCVSVAGVTGAREALPPDLGAFLQRVRRQTELSLAVGFGISRREHVEALRGQADAAIVGSAIVDVIEASPRDEREVRVREYVEVLTGRREART
ncbi:MAG: tryptophan synthase subunit alpha [Chloroflexi bacterium RBG_16_68_14]|nr:MAG: tryptophan synthase subunit alpha [Chloroflexi bacterium RBG_16_68_14]